MEKGLKIMLVALAIFGLATYAMAQTVSASNKDDSTDINTVSDQAATGDVAAEAAGVSQLFMDIAVANAANGNILYLCGSADTAAGSAGFVASYDEDTGAIIDAEIYDAASLGAGIAGLYRLNALALDQNRNILHAVGCGVHDDTTADTDSDNMIVSVDFSTAGLLDETDDVAGFWDDAGALTTEAITTAAGEGAASSDDTTSEEAFGVAVDTVTNLIYVVGTDDADTQFGVDPDTGSGGEDDTSTSIIVISSSAAKAKTVAIEDPSDVFTALDDGFYGVAQATNGIVAVGFTEDADGINGLAVLYSTTLTILDFKTYDGPAAEPGAEEEIWFGVSASGNTVVVAGLRTANVDTVLVTDDFDGEYNGLIATYTVGTSSLTRVWTTETDESSFSLADGTAVEYTDVATDGSFAYVCGYGVANTAEATAAADNDPAFEAGAEKFDGVGGFAGELGGEYEDENEDTSRALAAKYNVTNGDIVWGTTYEIGAAAASTDALYGAALSTKDQTFYAVGMMEDAADELDMTLYQITRGSTSGSGGGGGSAGSGGGGGGGCGTVGLDAIALLGIAYLVNRKARKS